VVRTLFVASQVPWPLDVGSKIRIYNLLQCYAEIGSVTLLCFAQDQAEAQSVPLLEEQGLRVVCVPFIAGETGAALRPGKLAALSRAMHPRPWMVRYFKSKQLTDRLALLLAEGDFDILHAERLYMTDNLGAASRRQSGGRRPYRILDVDDLESGKIRGIAAVEAWRSWRKYLGWLEFLKLYTYERRVVPRFDCALVCSEKDRQRLRNLPGSPRVEVFPNGADWRESTACDQQQDDGKTLVFLGAMNYHPNEDAALFFAQSVFPKIKRRVAGARFVVAGKSPSARLRTLHNGADLIVTGYVENKSALFDSCTVFVVPIRFGGGTRLKILEAMAVGKAVVSTTVGCEGIDVSPGEDIVVADSAADLADACVGMLLDEPRRGALGRAGCELVFKRYRWDQIRARYVSALEDCLGGVWDTALQLRTSGAAGGDGGRAAG